MSELDKVLSEIRMPRFGHQYGTGVTPTSELCFNRLRLELNIFEMGMKNGFLAETHNCKQDAFFELVRLANS